eukprot:CAMPEP_0185195146 /NCGR_PEP_ID=MMETSP1140-20130426/33677_1 /TAXON_ID=298111 /ORGANISM="Pavlova sp., Strain CCMP459" /LENGTH=119 /DNA_ID=CAMNT_0027762111 /DNA_START=78 /DNA_END=433 /DNA_ORIENTATION=+
MLPSISPLLSTSSLPWRPTDAAPALQSALAFSSDGSAPPPGVSSLCTSARTGESGTFSLPTAVLRAAVSCSRLAAAKRCWRRTRRTSLGLGRRSPSVTTVHPSPPGLRASGGAVDVPSL